MLSKSYFHGGFPMNEYEMIRDILDKSSYTVAMCGTDMMKESGMPSLRAPEIAFSGRDFFICILYKPHRDVF